MAEKNSIDSTLPVLSGVFSCKLDENWTLTSANDRLFELIGYTQDEFEKTFANSLVMIVYEKDLPKLRESIDTQIKNGGIVAVETRIVLKDGAKKWVWISAEITRDNDGEPCLYCIFCDISERKYAQQELALSESRYNFILNQTKDTIFEWNLEKHTAYFSPAIEKTIGYIPQSTDFPDSIYKIVHPHDAKNLRAITINLIDGAENSEGEIRIKKADGIYVWLSVSASAIRDKTGALVKVMGMISDIHKKKEELIEVREKSLRDPLTNLYNHEASEALVTAYLKKNTALAAFIVIDIDNFKGVNDTLGHIYGDAVLSDMALHLKTLFSSKNIVGRIGGDEFIVFVENIKNKNDISESLNKIMDVFRLSLADRGVSYETSSSIGISFYPEDGESYTDLFSKADIAMYHSKSNGKNQYTVYNDTMSIDGAACPVESRPPGNMDFVPKSFHDNIVEYVLRVFLEHDEVDRAIPALMSLVGSTFNFSRIFIYESSPDSDNSSDDTLHMSYEWCEDGISSMGELHQSIKLSDIPTHNIDTDMFEWFCTSENKEQNEWLDKRGAKSTIIFPIKDGQRVVTVIGFEHCKVTRNISSGDRYGIKMISQTMGVFLQKERKQKMLSREQAFSSLILSLANNCFYGINAENHNIIFVSESTGKRFNIKTGDVCYKAIHCLDAPCKGCPMADIDTVEKGQSIIRKLHFQAENTWMEVTATKKDWTDGSELCLLSSHNITQYHEKAVDGTFLSENIPGGLLCGYLEEGLPVFFSNEHLRNYLGYDDNEDFINSIDGKMINCIYEKDREAVEQSIRQQLEKASAFQSEYRMLKKDGTYIWVKNVGKKSIDENGKEVISNLCTDITKEKELQNQIEIYRTASRGGAYTVRFDYDFTLIYGNDILYDIFEYTKESFKKKCGNKCRYVLLPEDIPSVEGVLNKAYAEGATHFQWEARLVTGTGKHKWVRTTGTFEYRDKDLVADGFITDITEMHALSDLVIRSEERYRVALSQTNINVWEFDLKTQTILMTRSNHDHGTYTEVIENAPESIIQGGTIHPSSLSDYRGLYQKISDGKKKAIADILFIGNDTDPAHWERITYTTIFDSKGQPVRAVAVGEDITKQKEAEIKYQQELHMRHVLSYKVISSSVINFTNDIVENIQYHDDDSFDKFNQMSYDDLLTLHLKAIINLNDKKRFMKTFSRESIIEAFERGDRDLSLEIRKKDTNGHLIWANSTMRLVKDTLTGNLYLYGTTHNIDKQKSIELSLSSRAEKDSLTNSYNRETAIKMMTDASAIAVKEKRLFALLLFDIDSFSFVLSKNDRLSCENLLNDLCNLLQTKFDGSQIIGRFYDDEFAVFVGNVTLVKTVEAIAEEIRQTVEMPYMFYNMKTPVTISVGIAFSSVKINSFNLIYPNAKVALINAKSSGQNKCVTYKTNMDAPESINTEYVNPYDAPMPQGLSSKAETVLLRCAFSLTSTLAVDKSLMPVLMNVANYYDADRAYIFLIGDDSIEMKDRFEWKKDNVKSKFALPSKIHHPELLSPEENQYILSHPFVKDISLVKDTFPETYEELREQGVFSYYCTPLMSGNEIIGYVGIDNITVNLNNIGLINSLNRFISNEIVKRISQKRQEYLVYHDNLTLLLNRDSFTQYSNSLVAEGLISLGIVSLDINGLKNINDLYGSEFGDNIVKKIASTLKKLFSFGKAYRFAGDEFLIICENISNEKFTHQVNKIKPATDKVFPSSISYGCVWADNDISLSEMMSHAYEKRFLAKQDYYKQSPLISKKYNPEKVKELTRLLDDNAFVMYLQPKAVAQSRAIYGAEALVRYVDPVTNQVVPPSKFIPILEKNGMINYIDFFIFKQVCMTLSSWKKQGYKEFVISLNFSRATLLSDNLIKEMEKIRKRYNVESRFIEIEITESLGLIEQNTISDICKKISEAGYRLSLDDFGAKYSNIAMLSLIKWDVLKIDKTLVNDLISNERTCVVVKSFISACDQLEISCIAEGVETIEQLEILNTLGCKYAQGYYFNKPIPLSDFEKSYFGDRLNFS